MQKWIVCLSIVFVSVGGSFVVANRGFADGEVKMQIIPPPVVVPFNDNKHWMLAADLRYIVGDTELEIVVPGGFVTDFASIPRAFWGFGFSPHEKYSKAAIVHDYLYWTQICTRQQSDNIFMIAMQESSVPHVQREEVYFWVRQLGFSAWDSNAVERSKGVFRVIPAQFRGFPGDVSWEDYRTVLVKKHKVNDPAFPSRESYCDLGNSTVIPK